MVQLMSIDKLSKKFTSDIMFTESKFCRINIDRLDAENGIYTTDKFMVRNDYDIIETITSKSDTFDINPDIDDDEVTISYHWEDQSNNIVVRLCKDDIALTPVYELSTKIWSKYMIILTVFRYSGGIIWPVMYKVSAADVEDSIDIVEDFWNGCSKYGYEPIFKNASYKAEMNIKFDKNDKEINAGFDIKNTAEFFECKDLIDDLGKKSRRKYTWNPDTKLMSVQTYHYDDKVINVDLYYVEDPEEFIDDDIVYPKKVFSYNFCMDDPTFCMADLNHGRFYKDDHVEVKYACGDMNVIEEFEYILDGETIIKSEFTSNRSINTMIINNLLLDDNVVINSSNDVGFYSGIEGSFSYHGDINKISNIKSYVYDYDNIYMRSIAWNLIRIAIDK